MYLEGTTEVEIFNILSSLNTKKSVGVDEIRPRAIKNNAQMFAPITTKIINLSIEESKIPNEMKIAFVKPIYKSGKKSEINNYRPISMLPIVEKIYERVIVRRLNSFIKKHKLIHKQQYGFQAEKSINKLLGDFASHLNEVKSKTLFESV